MKLLVATSNAGKAREFADLLAGLPITVSWLSQEGVTAVVEETGHTFIENAQLKAHSYSRLTGLLTLGEDSGLEVDALGGDPGVYSARFAGPAATDQERNLAVLRLLAEVPWERRTARFRAAIALSDPRGILSTAEGIIEGLIALAPVGTQGFGYDPIFYVPELDKTMAQLEADIKNSISHRYRAVLAIRPSLVSLLKSA